MTCLHVNRKAHMTCNFNCHVETEGLFKVTGIVTNIVRVVGLMSRE